MTTTKTAIIPLINSSYDGGGGGKEILFSFGCIGLTIGGYSSNSRTDIAGADGVVSAKDIQTEYCSYS